MQIYAAVGPQVPAGPQDLALQSLGGVAGLIATGALPTHERAEDAGRCEQQTVLDPVNERAAHVDRQRSIGNALFHPGHETPSTLRTRVVDTIEKLGPTAFRRGQRRFRSRLRRTGLRLRRIGRHRHCDRRARPGRGALHQLRDGTGRIGGTGQHGAQLGDQCRILAQPSLDQTRHPALEPSRRIRERLAADIAQQRRRKHRVGPSMRERPQRLRRRIARQDLAASVIERAQRDRERAMQPSAWSAVSKRTRHRLQLHVLRIALDQRLRRKRKRLRRKTHADADEHHQVRHAAALHDFLRR